MRLAGYQPLTLIDFPGQLAAIVFTQGCPFRCVYCHNPELIPIQSDNSLSEYEVLERLKTDLAMLGGVVVTGGEPTLHPDLPEFLGQLKALGLKVKLDTNGVNPRLVERCIQLGVVDFFAMDIKQTFDQYQDVIGSAPDIAIENCQKTMRLLQTCGVAHEFRTTIASSLHTAEDLLTIASYLQPGETYTLQPVRYEKVLSSDLKPAESLDLERLKLDILDRYPALQVNIKS
jgi:pyruvate formate lyase activating enzyme